jgi:hypothetical protein
MPRDSVKEGESMRGMERRRMEDLSSSLSSSRNIMSQWTRCFDLHDSHQSDSEPHGASDRHDKPKEARGKFLRVLKNCLHGRMAAWQEGRGGGVRREKRGDSGGRGGRANLLFKDDDERNEEDHGVDIVIIKEKRFVFIHQRKNLGGED